MSPGDLRLAIIGAGSIVPMHLATMKAVGFSLSAIGSRCGSEKPAQLARNWDIADVCPDWQHVLRTSFDALLVAPSTDATAEILRQAMREFDGPILVEKPVACSSRQISALAQDGDADRVLVGYNRRHYSSVRALKAWLGARQTPVTFHARVPEASWDPALPAETKERLLLDNVVHVIDLLGWVFGPLAVRTAEGTDDATGMVSRAAILSSLGERPVLGTLDVTFGAPFSYSIEAFSPGSVVLMSPLEFFTEYRDIAVTEPTDEIPLRRYLPVPEPGFVMSADDQSYKPGFYQQSLELCALAQGRSLGATRVSATLAEAARAVEVAEMLLAAS